MLKRVPNRGSFVVELLCITALNFAALLRSILATISVVLIIWRPDLPYLCGLRCRRLTAHSESSTGLWVSLQSCCIERVTHLWIYDGRRFTEGKEQEAGKKVMGLWLRGKSIQRLLYLQGCPFIIIFYKNYDTFTFMHLADAFIQSDLRCIQARAGRYGPKNYHDNYFHISRYR